MEIEKIINEKIVTIATIERKEQVMVFEFKTPKGRRKKSVAVTITFDYIRKCNKRLMREFNMEGGCGPTESIEQGNDNFWLDVKDEVDYSLKKKFPKMDQDELTTIAEKVYNEVRKTVMRLKIWDSIE